MPVCTYPIVLSYEICYNGVFVMLDFCLRRGCFLQCDPYSFSQSVSIGNTNSTFKTFANHKLRQYRKTHPYYLHTLPGYLWSVSLSLEIFYSVQHNTTIMNSQQCKGFLHFRKLFLMPSSLFFQHMHTWLPSFTTHTLAPDQLCCNRWGLKVLLMR